MRNAHVAAVVVENGSFCVNLAFAIKIQWQVRCLHTFAKIDNMPIVQM
jgi:hypothetical protein